MVEDSKVVKAVFGGASRDSNSTKLHAVGGERDLRKGSLSNGAASPEEREEARLLGLFEGLRTKLLDLTLRNPMLNYKPQARSRRHLRLIDDAPEDLYRRLGVEEIAMEVVALPELPDVPSDEKTDEFEAQFAYMKASDQKYLAAVEELAASGRDNESEIAKLDRFLRDQVRKDLGLPPRPNRKQIDLAQHARQNGIDPSEELPGTCQRQ
jgi:hypothetical protein